MRRKTRTIPVLSIALAAFAVAVSTCREPDARAEEKSARGFALPDGDVEHGREAFVRLQCSGCHEVAGLEKELPRPVAVPVTGVKLGGLAMREPTDGELVTAIVNPSHQIYPAGETERVMSGEGSRMANLNEITTVQELIDIVAFLHERYETASSSESK
jgi:L-cysteine S-thiosulfotransferase